MFIFNEGHRNAVIYFIGNLLGYANDYTDIENKTLQNFWLEVEDKDLSIYEDMYRMFEDKQTYPYITIDSLLVEERICLNNLLEYLDDNDLWGDYSYEGVNLYLYLNNE